MRKRLTLEVTPLTCVHIGTGEEILPLEYSIKESKQGNWLFCRFSPENIVRRLPSDKLSEFEKLVAADDLAGVASFLSKAAREADIVYAMPATVDFVQRYNGRSRDSRNRLMVLPMYRPAGSRAAWIPGSSIKGAIRTAVLDAAARRDGAPRPEVLNEAGRMRGRSDARVQQTILDHEDPKDDPFRLLAVEDLLFEGRNTQIAGSIKNFKLRRQPSELVSIQILVEAVRGSLMAGSATGRCGFTLIEEDALSKPNDRTGRRPWPGIKRRYSEGDIVRACNDYYVGAFTDEYNGHYMAADEEIKGPAGRLKAEIEAIDPEVGEFLLRIGRYSHVEFTTLNEPLRRPNARRHGTTRMLFDMDGQLFPLGYCRCRLTPIAPQATTAPDQLAAKRFVVKKRPE